MVFELKQENGQMSTDVLDVPDKSLKSTLIQDSLKDLENETCLQIRIYTWDDIRDECMKNENLIDEYITEICESFKRETNIDIQRDIIYTFSEVKSARILPLFLEGVKIKKIRSLSGSVVTYFADKNADKNQLPLIIELLSEELYKNIDVPYYKYYKKEDDYDTSNCLVISNILSYLEKYGDDRCIPVLKRTCDFRIPISFMIIKLTYWRTERKIRERSKRLLSRICDEKETNLDL